MRDLLVMLPGAYFVPGDYARHGFMDALRARYARMEAIEVDLPDELYLDGDVSPWLHAHVVAPALALRPTRLWLLGISLGGLGALLYADAHPGLVSGVVVLAPFLGSRGLVREVADSGGLPCWEPGQIGAPDFERRLMAGLKAALPPRLHVGYGRSDRFAAASQLLADALPTGRSLVLDGGHDWPTWKLLWDAILAQAPFDDPEVPKDA